MKKIILAVIAVAFSLAAFIAGAWLVSISQYTFPQRLLFNAAFAGQFILTGWLAIALFRK